MTNPTHESAATYTVSFWGSDPGAGNDDCWTAHDFAVIGEALARYTAEPNDLPSVPGRTVAFIVIDGPGVHHERSNPAFHYSPDNDDEWEREYAWQAGMAGGCDWYNDAKGH